MGLEVSVERSGDEFHVTTTVPALRNGGANFGAMQAALTALTSIKPAAFDPVPVPADVLAQRDGHTADGGGIIPHGIAEAMIRAKFPVDPERDDDEGEPMDPYAGAACNIGGRCDE